jgi:hypothetical protein
MGWNKSQRGVLAAFLAGLIAVTGFQLCRNRLYVPMRGTVPAAASGTHGPVVDRLDPNAASWEALAAIPGMSESPAKAIVAYRAQWSSQHPIELPYRHPEDLLRAGGIGEATVEALKPFLIFPESVHTDGSDNSHRP